MFHDGRREHAEVRLKNQLAESGEHGEEVRVEDGVLDAQVVELIVVSATTALPPPSVADSMHAEAHPFPEPFFHKLRLLRGE